MADIGLRDAVHALRCAAPTTLPAAGDLQRAETAEGLDAGSDETRCRQRR
jgi:hypothetical protein